MELNKFLELEETKQIDYLLTLNEKDYDSFTTIIKKNNSRIYRKLSGKVSSAKQDKSIYTQNTSSKQQTKYEEENRGVDILTLEMNPYQPRKIFNEIKLNKLAVSIKEHGLLQKIVTAINPSTGKMTLIAGERRVRAYFINYKLYGEDYKYIQSNIIEAKTLKDFKVLSVIENMHREDMNLVEKSLAYKSLRDEGLTLKQIEEEVNISKSQGSRLGKVANLSSSVLEKILELEIESSAIVEPICKIDDNEKQIDLLYLISKGSKLKEIENTVKWILNNPDKSLDQMKNKNTIQKTVEVFKTVKYNTNVIEKKYATLSDDKKKMANNILNDIKTLQEKLISIK